MTTMTAEIALLVGVAFGYALAKITDRYPLDRDPPEAKRHLSIVETPGRHARPTRPSLDKPEP